MMRFTLLLNLITMQIFATEPSWNENLQLKDGVPVENVYQLDLATWEKTVWEGKKHALIYPIKTTKLLVPYHPVNNFFELDNRNPFKKKIINMLKAESGWQTLNDLFNWLGLNSYPNQEQLATYAIPEAPSEFNHHPMGFTMMERFGKKGFTFSCATCHSATLFDQKILGMTNRFPRANDFFKYAKTLLPFVPPLVFMKETRASWGETKMYAQARNSLNWIETKIPLHKSLDTSWAHVGLSLSQRKADQYATRTRTSYIFPRKNKLNHVPADSKPLPWWNVKYKTKWLADGTIAAGNPVLTNILWNEIGRSADLKQLESFLLKSKQMIKELTAAVYASKAPRYEDFFGPHSIDISAAKRGEKLFNQNCVGCHGRYEKAWNSPNSEELSPTELIQTVKVAYHEVTPVINVGTDPLRNEATQYLADDLNRLKISKTFGIKYKHEKGYIPPPLEGIWARWPYLHNNSVPSLCMMLTPANKRPKTFYVGPALDKERDFDHECNGYPIGDKTPKLWKSQQDSLFDTGKMGLSNQGHSTMLLKQDGNERYTQGQKRDLIQYLKTL